MISYAPVSAFSLTVLDDAYAGYAAPAGGADAPCLLVLMSDGTPVAYSRAARFSTQAEAEGRRLGWCGFFLPGRTLAMGLGDSVQIRCAVTDAVLAQPAFDAALLTVPGPTSHQISVIETVAVSRQGESCESLDQLAIFARYHLRKHGLHSFLHATYQMFFGRDADNEVIEAWLRAGDPDGEVDDFLKGIFNSPEMKAKHFRHIPGPFQTQFRYDRGLIG